MNFRRSPIHGEEGITLLEVILSMIILSVVLVGLMDVIGFESRGSVNSELTSVDTQLARQEMEQLLATKRANGFSAAGLAVTPPSPGFIPTGVPGYDQQVEICTATVTGVSITKTVACNVGGTSGYKVITVTVRNTGLATPVLSELITVITDF